MTTNEYGNSDMAVGVGYGIDGVKLFVQDPRDGSGKLVFTVEPEFARRIAESLTLRSFECEDDRRAEKSGGPSGT